MDPASLRCKMVWTQSGPPEDHNHFLYLEQITSPDKLMNRLEREQLEKLKFSKSDVTTELQWLLCTICLQTFKNEDNLLLMPNCSHYFHEHCLNIWLADVSATCHVCLKNARIRQILCFPLLTSNQMLQGVVRQTNATMFHLLRSILEPNIDNQYAMSITENVCFNEQYHFAQLFIREMDINLQPNFLQNSINVMRCQRLNAKYEISNEFASIAAEAFDLRFEHSHENKLALSMLRNWAQEIIQQNDEVLNEISLVEQHLDELSKTKPEIYVTYIPPFFFSQDLRNSLMRRIFRQSKNPSFSGRDSATNITAQARIPPSDFVSLEQMNINQHGEKLHQENEINNCKSLKIYECDSGQVLTYYFHPPTTNCYHREQFYLKHLDSSSDDRLKGHRYIMCRALPRYVDATERSVQSNTDTSTGENIVHVTDESLDALSENNDFGHLFGICDVHSVVGHGFIGETLSHPHTQFSHQCNEVRQTPEPSTMSKNVTYPEITNAHYLMLRYPIFSIIEHSVTYIDFALPQNLLQYVSSVSQTDTTCASQTSNSALSSNTHNFVSLKRNRPSDKFPVFITSQENNVNHSHCSTTDNGIAEYLRSVRCERPMTRLEREFHADLH